MRTFFEGLVEELHVLELGWSREIPVLEGPEADAFSAQLLLNVWVLCEEESDNVGSDHDDDCLMSSFFLTLSMTASRPSCLCLPAER